MELLVLKWKVFWAHCWHIAMLWHQKAFDQQKPRLKSDTMMFCYLESKLFKYAYTGAVTRWIWGHTARLLMINSTAHQCITETSLCLFQLCATVLVTPEDEDTPLTCLTSGSFIKWCCRRWSARVLLPHALPVNWNVQLCDRLSLPFK